MARFLRKTSLCDSCYSVRALIGRTTKTVSFTRIRWFSVSPEESQKHSFTVSYLMNSLGFSENKALSALKQLSFESREKPDKAIEFFEGQGFTRPQILSIVKAFPQVLESDTNKIVLPKLEFLRAKGLSTPEIASIMSKFPTFITCSLAKKIVPCYDFLKNTLGSDEKAISVMRNSPDILWYNLEKYVLPNVNALRKHGVCGSNIFRLVLRWPKVLTRSPAEFGKAVERAVEIGFDASTVKFVQATVAILIGMKKSGWEVRAEAYKKWGWSEEEVLVAFKEDPLCMLLSLDKITQAMEFFVEEMGLKADQLAKSPSLVSHSLKKVKLRCSVYRALVSQGLLKKDVSIEYYVSCSEKEFMKKFVTRYVEEAPELLDLYKGNANL